MIKVLHDLPYPKVVLEKTREFLKDDGYLLIIEINTPEPYSKMLPQNGYSNCDLSNFDNFVGRELYNISLSLCLPTSMEAPGSAGIGTAV